MLKRETWIVLILLAGLAGLTWYLNRPETEPVEVTVAPDTGALESNLPTPTYLSITPREGDALVLESRTGGVWYVLEPAEEMADPFGVQSFFGQVSSLQILTTLDETPDLAILGLDEPAYTIVIRDESGEVVFKIGNLTVTGSGYYAQDNEGVLHVVDRYAVEILIAMLANPPYAATPAP